MITFDEISGLIILLIIFFLVYTRMKRQDLKDTWDEVASIFETIEEVPEYYGR